jgi:hypothetical protein
MKKSIRIVLIIMLSTFAVLTLYLSSSVIFDWFGVREKEGNYVLLVIWANFICSFLYLLSIYGIIKLRAWATKPLIGAFTILVLTGIFFYVYIQSGGIYETKTIGALFFRTLLTLIFMFFTYLTTIKWKR